MTNSEFKEALTKFKFYLKPALFAVLSENSEVFSEVTRKEIIEKLEEADQQMQDLYDYQEKRNKILRKGIEKIEEVYTNVKARFKTVAEAEKNEEKAQADELISNL